MKYFMKAILFIWILKAGYRALYIRKCKPGFEMDLYITMNVLL